MLRAHSRAAGLPELEGLSVEEFRTSLRTSVLPRLALMKVVTYAAGTLGDAAPIAFTVEAWGEIAADRAAGADRSEEHTSELPSQSNIVCRLLPGKKKTHYSSTQV